MKIGFEVGDLVRLPDGTKLRVAGVRKDGLVNCVYDESEKIDKKYRYYAYPYKPEILTKQNP